MVSSDTTGVYNAVFCSWIIPFFNIFVKYSVTNYLVPPIVSHDNFRTGLVPAAGYFAC